MAKHRLIFLIPSVLTISACSSTFHSGDSTADIAATTLLPVLEMLHPSLTKSEIEAKLGPPDSHEKDSREESYHYQCKNTALAGAPNYSFKMDLAGNAQEITWYPCEKSDFNSITPKKLFKADLSVEEKTIDHGHYFSSETTYNHAPSGTIIFSDNSAAHEEISFIDFKLSGSPERYLSAAK